MRKIKLKTMLVYLSLASLLFAMMGCSKAENEIQEASESSMTSDEKQSSGQAEKSSVPEAAAELIYYTTDLQALNAQSADQPAYITKRMTIDNYFEIDQDSVLWGRGRNHYGQLGQGRPEDIGDPAARYDEPVKIAENVVHVDVSEYGYFTIFITEEHQLYGVGVNRMGVLRQPCVEHEEEQPWRNPVPEPVLLMENVAYASAGRESISVLTTNGEVYWWGSFCAATGTNEIGCMYSEEPRLMLQSAIYTTCGGNSAAAIGEDGRLWLWGCNVWGQCGSVGNDYEEEPICAAEKVDMVWVEGLSSKQSAGDTAKWQYESEYASEQLCPYSYTTFIRTKNGNMMACGIDLPNEEKEVAIYGNLDQKEESAQSVVRPSDYQRSYSPEFVKVQIKEK